MDIDQHRQTELLESIDQHLSAISEDVHTLIGKIEMLDERIDHLEKINSDILNQ